MFKSQLGNNIAALRKQKNLSQQELGAALNLPAKVIADWESGLTTPNDAHINKLAEFLGVSLPTLMNSSFAQSILVSATPKVAPTHVIRQSYAPARKSGTAKAMYVLLYIACGGLVGGGLGSLIFAAIAPIIALLCSILMLLSPILQAVALILFVLCKKTATNNLSLRRTGYAIIILYYVWSIASWVLGNVQIQSIWISVLDLIIGALYIATLFVLFKNIPSAYGSNKPTSWFKAALIFAGLTFLCLALVFTGVAFFAFLALLFQNICVILLAFAKEDKTW